MYMHVCIHTYIIHTHIHTYTYIRAYIHTCILIHPEVSYVAKAWSKLSWLHLLCLQSSCTKMCYQLLAPSLGLDQQQQKRHQCQHQQLDRTSGGCLTTQPPLSLKHTPTLTIGNHASRMVELSVLQQYLWLHGCSAIFCPRRNM